MCAFCFVDVSIICLAVVSCLNPVPRHALGAITAGWVSRVQRPDGYVDVYVDNFLLLAQTAHQRQRVMRATLSAIDDAFRPVDPSDPVHRKEPASTKKMAKGDAYWSPRKRILGWDIDTEAMTLNLPPPIGSSDSTRSCSGLVPHANAWQQRNGIASLASSALCLLRFRELTVCFPCCSMLSAAATPDGCASINMYTTRLLTFNSWCSPWAHAPHASTNWSPPRPSLWARRTRAVTAWAGSGSMVRLATPPSFVAIPFSRVHLTGARHVRQPPWQPLDL